MKRTIFAAMLAAVATLSTGCASLTNNTSQAVVVRTSCGDVSVQGASCKIINPHGTWVVASTPGSVMIVKAPGDMAVDCRMPGVVADPVLYESHATLGAFGNLIAGGLLGFTIDAGRDAAWAYHPEMRIDLCAGQPDKTVRAIQSAAADHGGTSLEVTPGNTAPLARMQSTLPPGQMRYAMGAEALAKQRQCSATPVAVLSARGPATEVYTVPCNNGDALMLKCTWGDCKAI